MSIIYVLFAVLAKLTAVFISIPNPVLGGCLLTIISVFVGVNLSNLQVHVILIYKYVIMQFILRIKVKICSSV